MKYSARKLPSRLVFLMMPSILPDCVNYPINSWSYDELQPNLVLSSNNGYGRLYFVATSRNCLMVSGPSLRKVDLTGSVITFNSEFRIACS